MEPEIAIARQRLREKPAIVFDAGPVPRRKIPRHRLHPQPLQRRTELHLQLVQPLRIAGGQVVVLLGVARARVGTGVQARHKTALRQPVGHLLRAPCCGRGRGQHRHRAPAGQRRYGLQALHQPWGTWHGGGAHQRLAGCGRLERRGVAATAAAGL